MLKGSLELKKTAKSGDNYHWMETCQKKKKHNKNVMSDIQDTYPGHFCIFSVIYIYFLKTILSIFKPYNFILM